jgi:broad specificity phosphatase PhoE
MSESNKTPEQQQVYTKENNTKPFQQSNPKTRTEENWQQFLDRYEQIIERLNKSKECTEREG